MLTRRFLTIITGMTMILLLMFTSCVSDEDVVCDHCHEKDANFEQLIDGIDMWVCDSCYEGYLQGAWGMD